MQADFEFHLNGMPQRADGAPASLTLLEYLRENLLTGAKDACSDGGCGACSVLIADRDEFGEPAYKVVNSCLLALPMLAGREVWTVEGIAELGHPVASALATCVGQPCGYCLPGVCASLCEAYERKGNKTLGDVVEQSVGNLCRCTGYRPFRDALIAALRARKGDGSTALSGRLPKQVVASASLAYRGRTGAAFYRPETLLEAVRLRQAHPNAVLQAGGTSRAWGELDEAEIEAAGGVISLEAVAELNTMRAGGDRWEVGAGVTITSLVARLGDEFPTLAQMAARFGSAQVRNRATVGGNLSAAAHHADLIPPLLALGASVRIDGVEGHREVALDEFFIGFRQTALREGEILAAVIIPRPVPVGSVPEVTHRLEVFSKISKRRHLDRAIANAAFLVEVDGDGIVSKARLAFGGIAAYAARAYEAEALVEGQPWAPQAAQAAAAKLKEVFPASSDQRATADYRNALAAGLWQKFFTEHRDPAAPDYPDASVRRFLAKAISV